MLYLGVHVEPPHPAEEEEPLSGCFYDSVGVVSPGNLKLLTLSTVVPLIEKGGVSFSLSLPVVHNQLLCFADKEMEIVVLAPGCQGSDLLSVGRLIITGDQQT